jgi:putative tryptophan/tyrosine transport system substrate-binding protein
MQRRIFITLLGAAAYGWSPLSRAQQRGLPVIGYINAAAETDARDLVLAFKQGLGEKGYVEGQNVSIEYRWAEDRYDQLLAIAQDLIGRHVAIIAATSTPVALAAKAATTTIPIVFTIGGDPIKLGLVKSLSRPAGNITGVTRFNVDLVPKRLQLLQDSIPHLTVAALLVNPSNPNTQTVLREVQEAARSFNIQLHFLQAHSDAELDMAFGSLRQLGAAALLIANDPFFNSRADKLAELTVRFRIPTIYQYRQFVEAGGLMSYGASNTDSHRQLGNYVGRILAGAKPADLPVEQSTRLDLLINLKTAKVLGLTIPSSVLARAAEVIE